jgi:predicted nucleotide-binding protein (sugar kinase/HSP70/actin superfamily)
LWRQALIEAACALGFDAATAQRATAAGEEALRNFRARTAELGRRFAAEVVSGQPCVVLLGRAYSLAPELNMEVAKRFAALGLPVAPQQILPTETEALDERHYDLIFKSSQDLVAAAKYVMRQPANLHPVFLNQFLCRQDSSTLPLAAKITAARLALQLTLDENAGTAGFKTRCAAFLRAVENQAVTAPAQGDGCSQKKKPGGDPFGSFRPAPQWKRNIRVVWVSKHVRFYAAAFNSIGLKTEFLPEEGPDVIERGRKYFSKGEPCLPFVQLAGALEGLSRRPDFDPDRDLLHVPGTRHCASSTLPHLFKDVLTRLGLERVRIVSPRDGLDAAEGIETFGVKFVQNLIRALFGGEYLKKLLLSVRPYELRPGETERVYNEAAEEFYAAFAENRNIFTALRAGAARLAAVPTAARGSRPQVLVTGEYVVRTNSFLNDGIHKKIERLGGEALYTPLFTDYVDVVSRRRPASLWRLGLRGKALREAVCCAFCRNDIRRIKNIFANHIPAQIEPNMAESLKSIAGRLPEALDPVLRLEFSQALWNRARGDLAGVVNVAPFGCSISTAVEPLLHELFDGQLPLLSLAFDGQSGVHTDNRLAAFMESVRARSATRTSPPLPIAQRTPVLPTTSRA